MERDIAAILRECRNGDSQAFARVLDRYQKPVFNLALRMVGDVDDAKDVTQTAFLKAFENLERYDPNHRFFSWIYRIAINESINLLKKRQRVGPLAVDRVSGRRSPEEMAHGVEVSAKVQEALMRLRPKHRAVIVLRHFRDCTYQDIAQILDMPEKTVKSTLFSARKALREALLTCGILKP